MRFSWLLKHLLLGNTEFLELTWFLNAYENSPNFPAPTLNFIFIDLHDLKISISFIFWLIEFVLQIDKTPSVIREEIDENEEENNNWQSGSQETGQVKNSFKNLSRD